MSKEELLCSLEYVCMHIQYEMIPNDAQRGIVYFWGEGGRYKVSGLARQRKIHHVESNLSSKLQAKIAFSS